RLDVGAVRLVTDEPFVQRGRRDEAFLAGHRGRVELVGVTAPEERERAGGARRFRRGARLRGRRARGDERCGPGRTQEIAPGHGGELHRTIPPLSNRGRAYIGRRSSAAPSARPVTPSAAELERNMGA